MTFDELLKAKREQILRIAQKHGAYNVRVFGSVVRGEIDEHSDIDLLVDLLYTARPCRIMDRVAIIDGMPRGCDDYARIAGACARTCVAGGDSPMMDV